MKPKPYVILVNVLSNPDRVRTWCEELHPEWKLVFLSDDYLELSRWRSILGSHVPYIPLSAEIESAASKLRRPFLDWIAQLGTKFGDPAWFASRVSERNTMVSPLFLNLCYCKVIQTFLENTQSNTIVAVGDVSLISLLRSMNWPTAHVLEPPMMDRIFFRATKKRLKQLLSNPIVALPVLIFYRFGGLLSAAIQARIAGAKKISTNSTNLLIIHTYIEESSFSDDFSFYDRYFPMLDKYYIEMGYDVVVLPVMFNISRSHYKAWSWIRKSQTVFINPFFLYRFSDYIFALRIAFRSFRLFNEKLFFGTEDITPLVKAEASRTAFDSLLQILYLRLPLRLLQNKVQPKAVIAEFENMIPEKMLITGFRKHQPATQLIGFQHGALYPNFLCNFTPKAEESYAPMYDRIVCNGSFFRNVLISEGLNPKLAVVGGALRYRHLSQDDSFSADIESRSNKSIDLLVPLPLANEASVELVAKLIAAFKLTESKILVTLKAHPMSSVRKLIKIMEIECLPSNFSVSSLPLRDLLPVSRAVISLSTCSMFEAAAAGVPIIRVKRETALDLDPLGFFKELPPPVCSISEIVQEVKRCLQLDAEQHSELIQTYRQLLAGSFHPCNSIGMQAFLPIMS